MPSLTPTPPAPKAGRGRRAAPELRGSREARGVFGHARGGARWSWGREACRRRRRREADRRVELPPGVDHRRRGERGGVRLELVGEAACQGDGAGGRVVDEGAQRRQRAGERAGGEEPGGGRLGLGGFGPE